MHSAIRFSRSRSQSSRSTTSDPAAMDGVTEVSAIARHTRSDHTRGSGRRDDDEPTPLLPSSLPSAPSRLPSSHARSSGASASRNGSTGPSSNAQSQKHEGNFADQAVRGSESRSTHHSRSSARSNGGTASGSPHSDSLPYSQPQQHQQDQYPAAQPPPPPLPFLFPPPSTGTFSFAVPNIPWIPPPPILGLPPSNGSNIDQYYAPLNANQEGVPFPAGAYAPPGMLQLPFQGPKDDSPRRSNEGGLRDKQTLPPRRRPLKNARRVSPMQDAGWPTPDQLPLPTSFPMPPRVLPVPSVSGAEGRSMTDMWPLPPLPPWWFLQALQVAGPRHEARTPSSSFASSRSSSGSAGSDSSRDPSPMKPPRRRTSPVVARRHAGVQVERLAPPQLHAQDHRLQQPPPRSRAGAVPAGSVQTPAPIPRHHSQSSRSGSGNGVPSSERTRAQPFKSTSNTSSDRPAPRKPYHEAADHDSYPVSTWTASAHLDKATASKAFASAPLPQEHREMPSTGESPTNYASPDAGRAGEAQRVQRVLNTAESYLDKIEDLYQRLRHRYEEVLLSPVKAIEYAEEEGERRGPKADSYVDRSMTLPRQDAHQVAPDAVAAPAPKRPVGSGEATLHNPATEASSTVPVAPAKKFTDPRALSWQSASALSSSSTASSQSLRHELAMLESQWQRLEELKQHGRSAAGVHAPPVARGGTGETATVPYGGVPEKAVAEQQAAGEDSPLLSNESVLQLIHDRKRLLASAP